MKRKTFSILFFIKRTKLLKNGEAPIFLRITVDGLRSETSILRSISPTQWNEKKGCANPVNSKNKELNHYLEHVRYKLYEVQKNLEDENIVISAQSLKCRFTGEDDKNISLVDFYQDHNVKIKELIGKGMALATFKRHETSLRHVQSFIKYSSNKDDLSLKEVDSEFIKEYDHYLRVVRNCNNNSTVKYVRNLGKIVRSAKEKGLIKQNPMDVIKLKTQEVEKPFLNKIELENLINKEFSIKRIEQVKDVFVFCCFTGLAFVDVKGLTPNDVVKGVDGQNWIRKRRQKTQNWCNIPILPIAQKILDKYSLCYVGVAQNFLLPVLSNQKMNAYLKEIAELTGITKQLTTHCARHTFATTVTLANNVSMETVSKMLGHSSLRMTQHYAKILDSTIGKEMELLSQKLQYN